MFCQGSWRRLSSVDYLDLSLVSLTPSSQLTLRAQHVGLLPSDNKVSDMMPCKQSTVLVCVFCATCVVQNANIKREMPASDDGITRTLNKQ